MSKQLSEALNGSSNGLFSAWIEEHGDTANLAWYPSAGSDMDVLKFLSKEYADKQPSGKREPFPDLFIFTDYYLWGGTSQFFFDSEFKNEYADILTDMGIEELPRLDLPMDRAIVESIDQAAQNAGRVVFKQVPIPTAGGGTSGTRYKVQKFHRNRKMAV
ncbi:MAG: hypothetical protein EOM45_03565 [Clostridia bacterium]|nr:hypothetical protein [Clostridia bacterium]